MLDQMHHGKMCQCGMSVSPEQSTFGGASCLDMLGCCGHVATNCCCLLPNSTHVLRLVRDFAMCCGVLIFRSVQADCSSTVFQSLVLLVPPLETMVTIGTSTSITWQDRRVVVPDELLVEIGEAKYLKIQPSHRIMMKLLLGSRTAGSLTSSPGLMKLKEARDEAIAEALKKEKGSGADDLFPDAKKKKVKVTFPTVDFVIVDGLQMGVQPKHKVSMDLLVLLDPETLDTVFTKITEDWSCSVAARLVSSGLSCMHFRRIHEGCGPGREADLQET